MTSTPTAHHTRRTRRGRAALAVAAGLLASSTFVPASAAAGPYAEPGWPTIHADSRNSDTSPVPGSPAMAPAWRTALLGTTPAYASIGPDGTVYVTSSRAGCRFLAIDGATGRVRWCSRLLNAVASTSTPLLGADGSVYVGDDRKMTSFTSEGTLRWATPIEGAPLSAQFTGDGNVLIVTHVGNLYVFDPATGEPVVDRHQLVPGASYDRVGNSVLDCMLGESTCAVANTPAVDPRTGLVVLTFWEPGTPQASLLALRYVGGTEPRVEELWRNDSLEGGSASSPAMSADGARIYVNDGASNVLALDAATGDIDWTFDIGFAAVGSPSVSADGLIVPAAGQEADAPLVAVRDLGDHAELAWARADVVQIGVAAQTAGDIAYTFVQRSDGLDLLTFDTRTGATLDRDAVPGASRFTVGTSIGPRGEVVTASLAGTVYAFHPEG